MTLSSPPSLPRAWLGALLFFTLATAIFTWPLVTHLDSTLPDWADPADSSWRIGSIAQQLLHDPLHLYQTRAFYPLTNGLALDELLTGQGLLAAPILWAGGSPPLAFNVLVFLSFALSGVAMWWLVRDLTGSGAAGLAAGLIYAFSPWHLSHYGHLGLGAQQWMVFALVCLRRFLHASAAAPRPWNGRALAYLALFAAFAVGQALVAGYYAYFMAILFGCYLLYYALIEAGIGRWLWDRIRRRAAEGAAPPWRRLAQQGALLAVAGALGLAALLPFVWPFVQAQRQFAFARSLTEAAYWSAAPGSLLRTVPQSWLYAPVQVSIFGLETSSERAMYPGLVALALALVGLATKNKINKNHEMIFIDFILKKWRRGPQRADETLPLAGGMPAERWLFAGVALLGLVLSFGPAFHWDIYSRDLGGPPLPYAWLYKLVPGFDALRVPARFGQLFMLGLAVCAGYGVAALLTRVKSAAMPAQPALIPHSSFLIPALVLLLIGLDYWAPGPPAVPTPTGADAPPVYRWLAGPAAAGMIPPEALLLELPIGAGERPINTSPITLMYGLAHGRPLLNGSANIIPPGYDRLFYEMRRFPTPGTLDLAEGLGVQYLVVHSAGLLNDEKRADLAREAAPGGRLDLLASFPDLPANPAGTVAVYRLRPDPARQAALAAAIPPGAAVLLADHPGRRRLYTTVVPRLLGPDRRYFVTYPTIYTALMPNTQPADPDPSYPYAVFYADPDAAAVPAQYGYTEADRVWVSADGLIAVYHKR